MGRYHIATGKIPEESKEKPSPINFSGDIHLPDNTIYLGKNGVAIPIYPTEINISTTSIGPGYTTQVSMSFNITPEQSITSA